MNNFHKIFLAFLIPLTFPAELYSQDESITVFINNHIQFSDSLEQGDVKVFDKGRIILRTLAFPKRTSSRKITAKLRIRSLKDPWDRFGSVFIRQDGEPDVEMIKFVTGFGTGRQDVELHSTVKQWAEYSEWIVDVSILDVLLQDSVAIGAMIDTWVNPGWELSLELNFADDTTAINPSLIQPVLNTTGQYTGSEFFSKVHLRSEFTMPDDFREAVLVMFSSGHGGTSLGDEFHPKHNVVYINDKEKLRFIPWRSDCLRFREYNPTSAKWEGDIWSSDLDRSGWCPGDVVEPLYISLFEYKPGMYSISYDIENQSEIDLNYWNVSSYLAVWE